MHRKNTFRDDSAVSQVIGAALLIMAAVVVFVAIYNYVIPLPLPPPEPNVEMRGYVTEDGSAVIEHIGGEILDSYEVYVDGELEYESNGGESWEIGETYIPQTAHPLINEDDQITVLVFVCNGDGSKSVVFNGVLSGNGQVTPPSTYDESFMLISSLRTDTTDEDLICYDNGTFPDGMSTYIFKWMVDSKSLTYILLPFDTESSTLTKDYSDNGYDGTVVGPQWTGQGKVGGAYEFDGASDYITMPLPPLFETGNVSTNDFTISLWLKSNDVTSDHRVVWVAGNNDNFATIFQFGTEIHFGVYEGGIKRAVRTGTISDNTWYNIVGVWDASEDSLLIYLNGDSGVFEVGYRNYPLGVQPGFDIGHGTASSRFWDGYIDEVQLFDRALSPEQIYQMYRCVNDGDSKERVIVSEETNFGEEWQCIVIPNDGTQDLESIESNILQIINYPGGE